MKMVPITPAVLDEAGKPSRGVLHRTFLEKFLESGADQSEVFLEDGDVVHNKRLRTNQKSTGQLRRQSAERVAQSFRKVLHENPTLTGRIQVTRSGERIFLIRRPEASSNKITP